MAALRGEWVEQGQHIPYLTQSRRLFLFLFSGAAGGKVIVSPPPLRSATRSDDIILRVNKALLPNGGNLGCAIIPWIFGFSQKFRKAPKLNEKLLKSI